MSFFCRLLSDFGHVFLSYVSYYFGVLLTHRFGRYPQKNPEKGPIWKRKSIFWRRRCFLYCPNLCFFVFLCFLYVVCISVRLIALFVFWISQTKNTKNSKRDKTKKTNETVFLKSCVERGLLRPRRAGQSLTKSGGPQDQRISTCLRPARGAPLGRRPAMGKLYEQQNNVKRLAKIAKIESKKQRKTKTRKSQQYRAKSIETDQNCSFKGPMLFFFL